MTLYKYSLDAIHLSAACMNLWWNIVRFINQGHACNPTLCCLLFYKVILLMRFESCETMSRIKKSLMNLLNADWLYRVSQNELHSLSKYLKSIQTVWCGVSFRPWWSDVFLIFAGWGWFKEMVKCRKLINFGSKITDMVFWYWCWKALGDGWSSFWF